MKNLLKIAFGLALAAAMMIPASLIASAADGSVEVNGCIADTGVRYHIIYNANGSISSFNGPDVMPGHTDTVLSLADTGIVYAGYMFTGWNAAADGSGTVYKPGNMVMLNSGPGGSCGSGRQGGGGQGSFGHVSERA